MNCWCLSPRRSFVWYPAACGPNGQRRRYFTGIPNSHTRPTLFRDPRRFVVIMGLLLPSPPEKRVNKRKEQGKRKTKEGTKKKDKENIYKGQRKGAFSGRARSGLLSFQVPESGDEINLSRGNDT